MINRSKQFVSIIYISIVKHICPKLTNPFHRCLFGQKKTWSDKYKPGGVVMRFW